MDKISGKAGQNGLVVIIIRAAVLVRATPRIAMLKKTRSEKRRRIRVTCSTSSIRHRKPALPRRRKRPHPIRGVILSSFTSNSTLLRALMIKGMIMMILPPRRTPTSAQIYFPDPTAGPGQSRIHPGDTGWIKAASRFEMSRNPRS